MKPKLVAIVGPTASGKSAVGVEVARRLHGEVVSCDSMQVYRGMRVCTQAPPKNFGGVRHHLVSFVEPSRSYNAARFRRDAEKAIGEILKHGKTPVLVGGTGLYLRALLDGLFDSKPKDQKFRRALQAEARRKGAGVLHEKLHRVDPDSAAKIHPNDLRRIIRALEVHEQSGRTMSELKPKRSGLRASFECRIFLVDRDRAQLYRRIEKRIDRMMRGGLLREAARLSKKRLGLTARTALGLHEMKSLLAGEHTRAEAVGLLKKNTRHYAKRQLSWFRHEKGIEVVPVQQKDSEVKIAKEILRRLNSYNSPHFPPLYKRGGMSKVQRTSPSFLKRGNGGVKSS